MARSLYTFALEERSWATQLHPMTMATLAVCGSVVVFSSLHLGVMTAMLGALLLFLFAGRLPARLTLAPLVLILPLCFFITLIQTVTHPDQILASWHVLGREITISGVGIVLGLRVTFRVVLLAITLTIFFTVVHPAKFTKALCDLGMPFKYAYSFTLALRFLPLMLEEVGTIKNAQQCRGYDIDRVNPAIRIFRVFPLMVPLVLIALRRASTIALALDLRAFGARPERTFFVEVQRGPLDLAFRAVAVGIAAVVFVAAVAGWV
jgi:energy-coupling factor transport system permease protein